MSPLSKVPEHRRTPFQDMRYGFMMEVPREQFLIPIISVYKIRIFLTLVFIVLVHFGDLCLRFLSPRLR
jgi:hypothetical protein